MGDPTLFVFDYIFGNAFEIRVERVEGFFCNRALNSRTFRNDVL